MPQIESLKTFIINHAPEWLVAMLIIVAGLLAAKLSARWLRAILNRSRIREDLLLKSFFLRAVSVTIVILSTLIALENIGLPVASLIAGLGITGLILGFALRDTLANFASGLLLLIYRPFRAGELIEVDGAQGVVEELTIVNMQLTTVEGVRVILPNSKVWGSKIVNYSLSERRRFELILKVRDEDADFAISAINDALDGDLRILKTPTPLIRVTAVGDGAATLSILAWTKPEDFETVTANENLILLNCLKEAELQVV